MHTMSAFKDTSDAAGGGEAVDEECITVKVVDMFHYSVQHRIRRSTKLSKVFRAYRRKTGISTYMARFLFYGDALKECDTPEGMEMEDGDIIDVHMQQSGMISNWTTTDSSDPLTEWLMLTDAARAARAQPLLGVLQMALHQHHAHMDADQITGLHTHTIRHDPTDRGDAAHCAAAAAMHLVSGRGQPVVVCVRR